MPVPAPVAALNEPVAVQIVAFLESIGIAVAAVDVPEPTFVPGIRLDRGTLFVDGMRLAHPGDLLHEAGHIAVMTPARRAQRAGDASNAMGDEIGAILWSWAALTHLGLPPETVFHPHGYRGASEWLIAMFSAGTFTGLPLLQWMGLTLDPGHAAARGVPPFPHMLKWLRDAP